MHCTPLLVEWTPFVSEETEITSRRTPLAQLLHCHFNYCVTSALRRSETLTIANCHNDLRETLIVKLPRNTIDVHRGTDNVRLVAAGAAVDTCDKTERYGILAQTLPLYEF